jgi:amino acid transporter
LTTKSAGPEQTTELRRELNLAGTVALSFGIMAPTAVLALNGVLPASLVGSAVPLVLLVASGGVWFVAYGFIRLASRFSHAGSTYAFAGRTLGPRAGFFAGWALLATYTCFTAGSTAEIGLFGGEFLSRIGVEVDWIVIALAGGAVIAAVAVRDIRRITQALLSVEGVSVLLVAILFVVILVRVIAGSAPGDQSFTLDPFTVPEGLTWSTVFLAATAGFISFAGFEGTATLGEESVDARRTIPRALILIVLATTVFFTFGFFVQTIGFGTDKAGIDAFAGSGNSLADLSGSYISSAWGDAIMFGATLSAFGSALGTGIAASRMLFALGRDGFLSRRLGQASTRTGAPIGAVAVVMTVAFVVLIGNRLNGTNAVNAFFYPATIGVLLILVAYGCTSIGALRYFFLGRRLPLWEAIFPIGALVIVSYTLYKQVSPVPAYPYSRFPYYAGGYLLVGLAIVAFVPGMAARIGSRLAAEMDDEEAVPATAPA